MQRNDTLSGDDSTPGLSIVIPFHNSQHNSSRLLSTLVGLNRSSIEVICIDDGSTDGTAAVLAGFAADCPLPVRLIAQKNGGPGSARNAGLRHARGEYVWFVDCDDDIRIAAIDHFAGVRSQGFDFIDYGMEKKGSKNTDTMGLAEGAYAVTDEMRCRLIESYGAICTKMTRRDLLVSHEIWYPERCFYEDNVLGSVLPFFVERFHKSGVVGYVNHLDFASVTRQKLGARFFDRLQTAAWGFAAGDRMATGDDERKALEDRFIGLFFVNTTKQIFGKYFPNTGFLGSLRNGHPVEATSKLISHIASLWYLKSWLTSARVHKYYRETATELGVPRSPLTRLADADRQGRVPWRGVWISSYALGSQRKHFERLRRAEWGLSALEPFVWVPPRRPGQESA